MLNTFAALDRDALVSYDVRNDVDLKIKVDPWINLKNECLLWHFDIENLTREYKIDLPIWCDLLCPPKAPDTLVNGLGAGGDYTSYMVDQIQVQLKKGINVLKGIDEETVGHPSTSTQAVATDIRAIYFKEIEHGDQKINYVVNGKFHEAGKASKKGHWVNLYNLADHSSITLENEGKAKALKDYFNSEKRNRLYSGYKWIMRPLLTIENRKNIRAVDDLHLQILSEREWNKRTKKSVL